jgi:hypothetical protein
MIRILVTGSRTWDQPSPVFVALTNAWHELSEPQELQPLTVVHGGASGVDYWANQWAVMMQRSGLPVLIEQVDPEWPRYGKQAGPIRNGVMVKRGADICLAFPGPPRPDGKRSGTQDCVTQARRAGIPVRPLGPWAEVAIR